MNGKNGLAPTLIGAILASTLGFAQIKMTAPSKTGYAPVNGLKLYYAVHGAGEPLILLHGALGAGDMFNEILPALASRRQVIVVDMQAHGHTADIDRPLSFTALASDTAALIKHLGFMKADAMGDSLGGGIALRTAVEHPELVRKLVIVSAAAKRDGWYPEVLAGMSQMGPAAAEPMKQSPMYQVYARVAPIPAISKARLAILPGLTPCIVFHSPALVAAVTPFLDAPIPGAK